MKNISRILGPKFRKIRKEKHLTLDDVVKEGVSISRATLARWEVGKQDITTDAYRELLKRVHLSSTDMIPNGFEDFANKIGNLYRNDENNKLKTLSQKLLLEYKSKNNFENLLRTTTACNFYMDLTDEDLTDINFKDNLEFQIDNIVELELWNEPDVLLFTNSQLFLKPQKIYEASRSLNSFICVKEVVSNLYSRPLLNSIIVLIKKKDLSHAKQILHLVAKLKISTDNFGAEHRINCFEKAILGIEIGDLHDAYEYTADLNRTSNERQLAKALNFTLDQFKEIYNL